MNSIINNLVSNNSTPKSLNLLVNVTPGFEVLLENEIKSLLKSNKLPVPNSFQRFNGSIGFTIPKLNNTDFINNNKQNYKNKNNSFINNGNRNKSNNDRSGSKEELLELSKYIWAISNCSRLSESIRIRIGDSFSSRNFNEFIKGIENISTYKQFLANTNKLPQVSVSCSSSKLYHSDAVKERFLNFYKESILKDIQIDVNNKKLKPIKKILKNLRSRKRKQDGVDSSDPLEEVGGVKEEEEKEEEEFNIDKEIEKFQNQLDQLVNQIENQEQSKIYIRLENDKAQISVDAAVPSNGELLYKRSNDKHVGEAPIRETIASAVLNKTQFNGNNTSLWDPFCGSGTFIQESLSNLKYTPSMSTKSIRHFQFENFNWHLNQEYREYLKFIDRDLAKLNDGIYFIGSDISQKAIDASFHNLKNEGYQSVNSNLNDTNNRLKLFKGDFEHIYNSVIKQLILSSLPEETTSTNSSTKSKPQITIITNLPYGQRILNNQTIELIDENQDPEQEQEIFNSLNQKNYSYLNDQITDDLKLLFKRFGFFLEKYVANSNSSDGIIKDVYVINGNLYFKNLSTNNNQFNFKWDEVLKFKNGGLNVELLKLNKIK